MVGATLEEMRELSLRSRRAHRAGVLAMLGLLLLVPLHLVLSAWIAGAWLAYALTVAGGALLLAYSFVAGKERGAFRKVFARLREERLTRTIVPTVPAAPQPVQPPGR